jgi:hypothetical protein
MTPRDIPGRLEIKGIFPWLEHLAPAQEPAELAPAAAPTALRAETGADAPPADLPQAA